MTTRSVIKIFELDFYGNAELKEIIDTEINHYASKKNKYSIFTVTELETFNPVLILLGCQSLS